MEESNTTNQFPRVEKVCQWSRQRMNFDKILGENYPQDESCFVIETKEENPTENMKIIQATAPLTELNGGSMKHLSDRVTAWEGEPAANFSEIYQGQDFRNTVRHRLGSNCSSNGSIGYIRDYQCNSWQQSSTSSNTYENSSTICNETRRSISDESICTEPSHVTVWVDGDLMETSQGKSDQDHIWLDKKGTLENGTYSRRDNSLESVHITKDAHKPVTDWISSQDVSADQRSLDDDKANDEDDSKLSTSNCPSIWCRGSCCRRHVYGTISMTLKVMAMFMAYCLVYEILSA